jgi:YD repeat-containing protein
MITTKICERRARPRRMEPLMWPGLGSTTMRSETSTGRAIRVGTDHLRLRPRNRRTWIDDPIASDRSTITGHTMAWEYDGVGNKLKETRADNAFRSWDYAPMNRLFHAIDWRMSASEPATTMTIWAGKSGPRIPWMPPAFIAASSGFTTGPATWSNTGPPPAPVNLYVR